MKNQTRRRRDARRVGGLVEIQIEIEVGIEIQDEIEFVRSLEVMGVELVKVFVQSRP